MHKIGIEYTKKKPNVFVMIYSQSCKLDVNQAVALSQHLELSREKQQILKDWMAEVNVMLPGKSAMLKVRQQMKPAICSLS